MGGQRINYILYYIFTLKTRSLLKVILIFIINVSDKEKSFLVFSIDIEICFAYDGFVNGQCTQPDIV